VIVIVTEADLAEVSDQGSLVLFVGTTEADRRVRFAVDHRMADGLVHEVLLSGEVPCGVESWQVMGVAS
jgi:hypothetical protein